MISEAVDPAGRPGILTRLAGFCRRHPDPIAAVSLALLPFAVLIRALAPGRVLSPADILLVFPPWSILAPATRMLNPLLTDVTFMFHPWLIYAGREVRDGHFPLWNPHSFAGSPFFANPQTALLFPLTWLAWVLPAPLALTLISILKLSLAGLGMYWFLRLLDLRPLAAFVGALAFMFNGALVTWLQWAVGNGILALPFLFAATERLSQRPGPRSIAGLAVVVALSIFGGYLQLTMLALLAAAAWAVCRSLRTEQPLRGLASWAAGAGLGVLMAAVQLWPFVEYTWQSSVYVYRSQWMPVMAAPARSLIALLMPFYYGSPTTRDFWGYWNFNEITASVGIVPWVVLPVALVGAWARIETRFFLALAVLAGVMCYDTPLLTDTLASLPPFSLVITFRLVAFLALALSVLCAIGVHTLLTAPPEVARRLHWAVGGGFAGLVVVAFAFVIDDWSALARAALQVPISVQYLGLLELLTLAALAAIGLRGGGRATLVAGAALLAVQLASVVPLAATYNPIIDKRMLYPAGAPALRHVQGAAARDGGRVMFGIGKNMGMLYGLDEVTGYDGMTPRRIEQLVSPVGAGGLLASGSINVVVNYASPIFDLLGVRRLVVPNDVGLDRLAPHFTLDYDGPDARVYVNPRALPRAFLVQRARGCLDEAATLRLMHDGVVNFLEEVLIDGCDLPTTPVSMASRPGRAEIVASAPERVLVVVESATAAYLVLTDTWYPGWRVRVDDLEQPVLRADHAFRAVRIPAGRHDVEFRYEPASFRWGLGLSALAAFTAFVLSFGPWNRRDA